MPLKRCVRRGKSGWKFGDRGFCFTGTNAKARAARQGRAIEANKPKRGRPKKK